MDRFKEAVDEGNLETAVKIYWRSHGVWSERIKYVIRNAVPNFIVSFIKQLELTNKYTLTMLCTERSLDVTKEVIERVEFPQDSLIYAASEPAVFSSPKDMDYLLAKIHNSGDLRCVIQNGIKQLLKHAHWSDKIPKVLEFFEGRILLSVNLHYTAIQSIFVAAAERYDKGCASYWGEHPAIDSGTYGDALVSAGGKNPQNLFFRKIDDIC